MPVEVFIEQSESAAVLYGLKGCVRVTFCSSSVLAEYGCNTAVQDMVV